MSRRCSQAAPPELYQEARRALVPRARSASCPGGTGAEEGGQGRTGLEKGPNQGPGTNPAQEPGARHIGTWLWTTSYPQPAVTWGLARRGPYLSTGECWSSLGGGRPRW